MRSRALSSLSVALLALGCTQQPSAEVADSTFADTIYTNGRIYTVNETQPWVEAVAIKDGKFVAVGSNADIEAVAGESTEVVDLGGAFDFYRSSAAVQEALISIPPAWTESRVSHCRPNIMGTRDIPPWLSSRKDTIRSSTGEANLVKGVRLDS